MTPAALLTALRAGGARAEAARAALGHSVAPVDASSAPRAAVARLLAASLRPADHALTCWLLEQEISAHEAAGRGAAETLFTLIAAVARYADPDDVLLLWHARNATAETRAGVDAEQALRAGFERVRRRLNVLMQLGGPRATEAACALEWLADGVAMGAAADLPSYFAWADRRFGLHVSGPT